MTFKEIINEIEVDISGRNLKSPNIRLNAINKVESYFKNLRNSESIIEYIIKTDKSTIKLEIEKIKNNRLNGSENSIINEIYKRVK